VAVVLEFLTDLYKQGLGYSAVNTARSALSAALPPLRAQTIGSHPHVVRFMKGIFELRMPKPRYEKIWDVSILLKYFQNKKENSQLSLPDLTRKLCALMLLASAQRVQTIHLIRVDCIEIQDNECNILIVDPLKQTKPGTKKTVLKFERYPENTKLCVISALEEYLKRTESKRCKTDKLLLCYARPYGPASKDTVARWLKTVLEEAGINNFAPHSFRSAASSEMIRRGVPIDEVLKTAGWSNASTFHKFYNRTHSQNSDSVEKQSKKSETNTILKYFNKK